MNKDEPDIVPNPQKFGYCFCCNKPMSESDWWGSQGHHCRECFSNLVFDDKYYYCRLHSDLPAPLKAAEEFKNHVKMLKSLNLKPCPFFRLDDRNRTIDVSCTATDVTLFLSPSKDVDIYKSIYPKCFTEFKKCKDFLDFLREAKDAYKKGSEQE